MRNDPSFWYLDVFSIVNSSGHQFLSNSGFETGDLTAWTYCNPNNATHAGIVDNSNPYTGSYEYADGSVNASDYLSQTFNVIPYNNYTVKFWLSAASNSSSSAFVTISS
ncbi:hypothetical protein I4U23_010842 [Adineta vaga]|nr:hypothetical protein I4U23_010842 [Adineta vaga]